MFLFKQFNEDLGRLFVASRNTVGIKEHSYLALAVEVGDNLPQTIFQPSTTVYTDEGLENIQTRGKIDREIYAN